jgi:hypothetical protein
MRSILHVLLMVLVINVGWAGPVAMSRQTITLPAGTRAPLFVDIDGDGRSDMFVINQTEKKLLNYHQRPDGFLNSPDQVIPLPPQTAWVALCDVDAHPGLELLMSTADGLVYSRQNGGIFESERHTLIKASQIFTNSDFPILTLLSTNKPGTNDLIPVITAGQTVMYHRNSAYEWSPGPPMPLETNPASCYINPESWTLGPNAAHNFRVQTMFRTKAEPKKDEEPENEAVQKLMADLKKREGAAPPTMDRVDIDGDGREDLVIWQTSGKIDFKTDIYVFLRGADQQLPVRPSQTLHCSRFVIPIGSNQKWSPVHDLRGDGNHELVLFEFTTVFTSPSGLVEMALSRGIECSLTIRTFHRGVFARFPDASLPVKVVMSLEELGEWSFLIQGDFNGDGHPDFLVRRSETQWNIFFSTSDGRWFAPQPGMTFEAPAQGYIEVKDLNGDGLSDIIWHQWDKPDLTIFMSPSHPAGGKNP